MSFPLLLGAATVGISLYEMWKASKRESLGETYLIEDEEEVNAVGIVQGAPGPSGGFAPSLGPVQGIQTGGGGMSPGRWVPTTPMPTSEEVNRGSGDGIVWNSWGPGGWGWPYTGYYPYPYGYPGQADLVCRQSEIDPREFVCHVQYPEYRRRRAYAWAPYWGW